MKKISVIIPVYNIEKYLGKCLNSIEKQTAFDDLEIILIDDGSKDDSGKICDDFAKKNSNTVVIHQKNRGVSSARNKGIEVAKGDYISFVDGDDYLEKNHYEEMLKDLKEEEYDLIIHDYYVDFENSSYKYRKIIRKIFNRKDAIKELLSGGTIGNNLFDKLFKRNNIKDLRFDSNIKIGEDLLFIYQFLEKVDSVICRTIPTYHYIQRVGSAMNSKFCDKFFDIIKVSDMIIDDIKKNSNELIKYAQSLSIYSKYKTLERAHKMNGYNDYRDILYKLEKDIKRYSIIDGMKYMSHKKFAGLLLYKISPKLYLHICKIKKI